MRKLRHILLSLGAACVLGSAAAPTTMASVPESRQILLYPGNPAAYINGTKVSSGIAVIARDGRYFLPAAELAGWFGTPVNWDAEKGAVQIATPKAFLEFELPGERVLVNGSVQPWGPSAFLQENRLYIELDWLGQYIAYRARTDRELQRLELRYIQSGNSRLLHNDAMPNAKPAAKFSVDKEAYRIGEPIRYSNLSYDPQGDALTDIRWTGNAEKIFTPGLFKVSLQVADSEGNVSDTFSRNILVKDEPYLDPFEYGIYHEPAGTFVHEEETALRQRLRGIPALTYRVGESQERPLIVSDSPETFTEKGILYQERVKGKARLYADHVNGMDRKMKFAIVVTNPYGDRSITIKTTNRGEVYPSIYANLIGNEATIEFLLNKAPAETMVVGPLKSAYYKIMPDFYPGQGMNVIYDVDTDHEAYFSFVAMEQEDTLASVAALPRLPFSGNVRGTFTSSEVAWDLDASSVSVPSSFAIGDGTTDRFVTGRDFFMREPALNLGNYGVVYRIHVRKPPKMAVLILPRGGVFKGPFLVNGRIVQTPPSGVMMDYQGYTIIARTEGSEPSLDIGFSPAAGSAFPIDVIFYPLEKDK